MALVSVDVKQHFYLLTHNALGYTCFYNYIYNFFMKPQRGESLIGITEIRG